jgi:tetratricopeptide (TPR) repeat protein
MLFVVPPLVIAGAVGFERCVSRAIRPQLQRGLWTFEIAVLLLTLWNVVAMHPNQVVYFNRVFAGGIQSAALFYETDYWNHTYRQGIQWLEVHAEEFAAVGQKSSVGSLYPNLKEMVDPARFSIAEPEDADFYLANTRYDLHRMVPGIVIHTIQTQGVPLLYVIQPDDRLRENSFFDISPAMHNRHGDILRAQGELVAAIQAYEKTLARLSNGFRMAGFDSSGVFNKIGNVLLRLDRYDDAMAMFERIPDREMFAGSIANNVGMYFAGKDDFEQALTWLERAVEVAPDFYEANVGLGTVHMRFGNIERSAAVFQNMAKLNRKDIERQFELGNLLFRLGKFKAASLCFERMTKVQYDDVRGYYHYGIAQLNLRHFDAAKKAFNRVLEIDPLHVDAGTQLELVETMVK